MPRLTPADKRAAELKRANKEGFRRQLRAATSHKKLVDNAIADVKRREREGRQWINILKDRAIKRGDLCANGACETAIEFYLGTIDKLLGLLEEQGGR